MIDVELMNRDLRIEGFDLHLISGADATAQRLAQKLRLFRGEWFLNTAAGVPWFQEVLGRNDPRGEVIASIFRATLIDDPGVEELLEFDVGYEGVDRILTVNFKVKAIDGQVIEVQEQIV